jgi:UDP-glucose-4-epimerase GalE
MMDAVLESDVRLLVFSSSCAVYGIPEALPITESSPKQPINPYGSTKLFFEQILSAYGMSHGLRYAALRYFNAAGADPNCRTGEIHEPETHLIPLAIRAALGRIPSLAVFGAGLNTPDGTCIRDFIHVADLASAHAKALAYLAQGGTSIEVNLGTGNGTSIRDVLAMVEKVCGRGVPHTLAPPRAGDPSVLFAEVQRARDTLGWNARFDLQQIIATALRWEKYLPEFLQTS